MQKNLLLFGLAMLVACSCKSQSVENNISAYGTTFPLEKISLHFDKEAYLPGETIWFKAYLFEEDLPSTRSTNFYAALYDEQGKLLQQMLSPIINSSTDGHFDIPDSIKIHQVTCRAYTSWMLSSDSSSIYTKAIKLILPAGEAAAPVLKATTSLQFFPEGGDIIEGTKNTVAFKANLSNGIPIDVSGIIKNNQTGANVMPFKTGHDGLGRFDLEVEKGDRFFAEWTDMNGVIHETALPQPKPLGVSLKMTRLKDNLYYNIVNTLPGDSLHVLMFMYQEVFYKANISAKSGEPFNGIVPVKSLPSGVMQLTVFDADWQPVAERVAFINNADYAAPVAVSTTEFNVNRRGKNSIEISVPDNIPFNLSLSVTDAEINDGKLERNIFADMLLGGDVKGYIHNPAYYFTDNSNQVIAANLDLVMLTHGWRRYNWKDVMSNRMPAISKVQDDFLTLKGRVSVAALGKIKPNEKISLIINTKDSANNFYFFKPDENGAFSIGGMMFFDSSKLLFSFQKKKLLNWEISITNTFIPAKPLISASDIFQVDTLPHSYHIQQYLTRLKDSSRYYKNLSTVVVKARRDWRNDLYQMDRRYTSGVFTGSNGFSFDVAHDGMATAKFDVYDYVMGKVPGIRIDFGRGGKQLVASDGYPIAFFLNERQVANDEVSMLDVNDLAYIKYIDRFNGGALEYRPAQDYTPYFDRTSEPTWLRSKMFDGPFLSGFVHAFAFYFRKGADLTRTRSDMQLVKVAGYTPIKEFYSPDYGDRDLAEAPDNRNTLLWIPYILTDSAQLKVPITFYNNDFSKKLKLVLEGINEQGKLVHIEKILGQ